MRGYPAYKTDKVCGGRKYRDPTMDLGELYRTKGDDYWKDRKLWGAAIIPEGIDDENGDRESELSQNLGYKGDRLPALENFVENDMIKYALTDPIRPAGKLPYRYSQKR